MEIIPSPLSTLTVLQQKIKIACTAFDNLLNGGYTTGMITEVFGESGTDRTQICLQLVLHSQLPPYYEGIFCASIYIHSNNLFMTNRLQPTLDDLTNKYEYGRTYLSVEHVTIKRVDAST